MDLELDISVIRAIKEEIRKIEWMLYDIKHSKSFDKKFQTLHLKHKLSILMALIAHSKGCVHIANMSLEEQEQFLKENKDEWNYIVLLVKENQKLRRIIEGNKEALANIDRRNRLTIRERIRNLL